MAHVSKQVGFKCSGVIRTKLSNSTAVLLKQVLHAQRVHSEMVASFHTFHFPSKMLLEKTKEIKKSGENLVRN